MMRHQRILPVWLLAVVAWLMAAAVPAGLAGDNGGEIPFDEAHIFFELNNTDGDLGIHGKIDGGPWRRIEISDPNDQEIMIARIIGRLRRQGLTEFFFESAEPTFDELSPEAFFNRFPEGIYEVEGLTLDGQELESEARVTHRMPAPPGGITLNGVSDAPIMQERCDDESNQFDPTEVEVSSDGTVTIEWDAVTTSHPDLGSPRSGDIVIHNYEVVVEVTVEVDGEDFESVFSVILPPDQTAMTVPREFIDLGDEFKYEILAREESFNQTATESCFVLTD